MVNPMLLQAKATEQDSELNPMLLQAKAMEQDSELNPIQILIGGQLAISRS